MSVPTINVNLKQCDCLCPGKHGDLCPGRPVLIPCPIPRSVVFTGVLGACDCSASHPKFLVGIHHPECPAIPIRVACYIDGETWETSLIRDQEVVSGEEVHDTAQVNKMLTVCRDRWALVKALVLGSDCAAFRAPHIPLFWEVVGPLVTQRDAVFSALCDMARAEDALHDSADAAARALGAKEGMPGLCETITPSHDILAAYVEHLIEQVGVLP